MSYRNSVRKKCFKVIIIGGGLAGLSAANHLVENGVSDICVVEAKSSLGGRIHTTFEDGNPLELGAQWIHGACNANSVFNLANKHKLCGEVVERLHEEAGSAIRRWPLTPGYILRPDGIPLSESATEQAYEIFHGIVDEVQFLAKHHHNTPKASRLSTFYNGRKKKALEALRKAQSEHLAEVDLALNGLQRALAIEAGHDLNKVKMESFAHLMLPGGSANICKGAAKLIDKLARNVHNVYLNHEVKKIDWSFLTRDSSRLPDKISLEILDLETQQSGILAGDFVICTMPLGYLKRNHRAIFVPSLDERKVKAIESLGMGQICKLFLEWAEPWWAPNEGGLQLAWPSPAFENLASTTKEYSSERHHWYKNLSNFSEVENQPRFLSTWLSGEAATVVDHLDDEEVLATITDVLRRFTGDPGLNSPRRLVRHRWNQDQFIFGGWAFQSTLTSNEDPDVLAAPLPSLEDPKLLFAGEATHHVFLGNLLGARLSGLREADRVLQKIEAMNRLKSLSLNGLISRSCNGGL